MRQIKVALILLPNIVSAAFAAPVIVDLAGYGAGVEALTDSELLESDPRDAIGGSFSGTEPGHLIFADKAQPQQLVIRFPGIVEVRSVALDVTPQDSPRMPERVEILASPARKGNEWERIAIDLRPSGTPLLYDGFDPVSVQRIQFKFGVAEDERGARIREIRVYSVGREALYPQLEPPPHWTGANHPGRAAVDAWGWHAPITYQRTYRRGVGFDYFRDRVIDESYRWGANLLELYPPHFMPTLWPFEWPADDVLRRPETYPYWDDPRWKPGTFRALSRYAHSRGMLVQWFCHPEIVPGERGEPTFTDPQKIAENLTALRKLGSDYANAARDPWEEMFDGFGHEHWFDDLSGRTARAGWEWNPGMYFYSTSNWRTVAEPAYSKSLMCAGSGDLRGRDDQWLLPLEKGLVPLSIQADSRTLRPPEETWAGWSRFGGGTYPDWILKQTNDFFRRRHMAAERPDATALWWLGEPVTVLPEEYRRYVYGISQDPMRCAVTAQLRTTGIMGHMDSMGRLGNANMGPRYSVPASAFFIQNNYFRLYRDANSDRTVLVYDPTRTAHFDADSDRMVLATDLLQVQTRAGGRPVPEPIWHFGIADGSPGEFRPRFDLPRGESIPFEPQEHTSRGRSILTVGEWDGLSSDLLPEGGFEEREVVEVREAVLREFPSLLASPPRGPREVVLRVAMQSGRYRLELSQRRTALSDRVLFLVDGSPVGLIETLDATSLETSGLAHALHSLEPMEITRQGLHEIALVLMAGDGFEIDALRLLYTGPVSPGVDRPEPYAVDEFVLVAGSATKEIPSGVGRAPYVYPENLHLTSELDPGTYRLRIGLLPEENPTYAQIFLGDRFVGAFVSGREATSLDIPFSVSAPGKHDLGIRAVEGPGCAFDFLALDRLSGTYRSFQVLEPAGYLAVVEEEVVTSTANGPFIEKRRFMLPSDTPALWLTISRTGPGAGEARTVLQADAYKTLLPIVREGAEADLPMEAAWRGEGLPDLVLRVDGLSTATVDHERLEIPHPGGGGMECLFAVLDGIYEMEMVSQLPFAGAGEGLALRRDLTAGGGEIVERNVSGIPLVRVLRIMDPIGTPYYVEEEGADGSRTWTFRGAQRSKQVPGTDLLKVYLPTGAKARIVPDGLIDGIARPGWGCQYMMALRNLARVGGQLSFIVDLFSVTPFIFSPRVEVSGPVREVLLDGRPYRYFDANQVFLPNRRGRYRVEVSLGAADRPHLTRTAAVVEEARWDEEHGIFHLTATLPEWCPSLPADLDLAALVDLEGRTVSRLSGGELEREEGGRAVVWYRDTFEVKTR